MHLKTFQLTDEAYNAPVEDLEKAKAKHGLAQDDFVELKFGERIIF
jgi:hypothetical protein